MVFVNITRNWFKNQWGNALMRCNPGSNLGCAHGHGRHLQLPKTRCMQYWSHKSGPGPRQICASSYANYSKAQDFLPFVPGHQCLGLVFPNHKKQLRIRPLRLQLPQCFDRVARAIAQRFTGVDQYPLQSGERQPRHGQTVMCGAQGSAFVPGLPSWDNAELVELQIGNRTLRQRHVGRMRWVKRATKDADAFQDRLR